MKTIAYIVACGVACFIAMFALAFAVFWISEICIPNRPVNYQSLTHDTFVFAVKIWCAAMIVYAVGFAVKRAVGKRK